jgi:hypothetical protein
VIVKSRSRSKEYKTEIDAKKIEEREATHCGQEKICEITKKRHNADTGKEDNKRRLD